MAWARAVLLPTAGRPVSAVQGLAGLAARQPQLLELLPEPQLGVQLHRPVSPRALPPKAALSQVPFLRRDTELCLLGAHIPAETNRNWFLGCRFTCHNTLQGTALGVSGLSPSHPSGHCPFTGSSERTLSSKLWFQQGRCWPGAGRPASRVEAC